MISIAEMHKVCHHRTNRSMTECINNYSLINRLAAPICQVKTDGSPSEFETLSHVVHQTTIEA